jgi:hypothetical protein
VPETKQALVIDKVNEEFRAITMYIGATDPLRNYLKNFGEIIEDVTYRHKMTLSVDPRYDFNDMLAHVRYLALESGMD